MGVLVNMRAIDGATVVRLAGTVDVALLERIGGGIVAACDGDDAIILDVNELTLADRGGFHALVRVLQGKRVRVVRQQSFSCATERERHRDGQVPIFRTLADALRDPASGDGDVIARGEFDVPHRRRKRLGSQPAADPQPGGSVP